MKWKNIGHEFDSLYEKCKGFFKKNIYLFGAGKIGKKYASLLIRYNIKIEAIIDNDTKKQNGVLIIDGNNIPIISFDDYMNLILDKTYIIVCVGDKYINSIKMQLLDNNLKAPQDFMEIDKDFENLLRVIWMYDKNEIYLPLAQISLTERCTLKCKKCAHACNLVSPGKPDLTYGVACESIDWFFKYIDYIYEFVLIGGEPFLYKYLKEIIEYTSKYRGKMRVFSITTNGTILPKDDILNACRKNDVLIRISNYSSSVPKLKQQHNRLVKKIKDFGVQYDLYSPDGYWMDYGFDYVDRKASASELEKVFDDCFTPCHEIRGSKFYFCVMARSVAENMDKHIGEKDYFDLADIKTDEDRMKFFEYTMGYSEKGYLDMCNFCYGAEVKEHQIPVAEQMDNKES